MRRTSKLLQATMAFGLAISLLFSAMQRLSALADSANVPSLVISQFKVTSSNGQFVTLYNTTGGTLDLSKYELEYFNSYDLSKATSSKLITLSGTVPPHGYYMVNDGTLLLCYQMTVDSASLGFSSTAGMVELLAFNQTVPGGPVVPGLQDYTGWSKAAANGAQTLPANSNAFLARRPLSQQNALTITAPGSGSWQSVQPDADNACNLVAADSSAAVPVAATGGQLLPASEPPATIINLASPQNASITSYSLPPADVGLMAPELTELLPNPAGTGNDAADEFIELYNPNSASFDLSGFELQAGTTSLHTYRFPTGTGLAAHAFTAYYSSGTGLSLSNSGGQVKLLDPTSRVITASAVYATADDGQAWALAKGQWYWTTALTPGAANVIKQPVSKTKVSHQTSKLPKQTRSSKNGNSTAATSDNSSADGPGTTPISPKLLALIVALALLYVGYEYRTDLANRFWQFRRHLGYRRKPRP